MHFSRMVFAAGLLSILLLTSHTGLAQPASFPSRPAPSTREQIAFYVSEASQRFGVPEAWITAVMRVESGGNPSATSSVGAMGLMQVMPGNYASLRARLGLGANAYDPHDNIMAGAAYLRELHDRYGAVGLLAAYNAGPGWWEDHLAGVRPLPSETIRYMARLAPMLGSSSAGVIARAVLPAVTTPKAAPIFVALSTRATATSSRPGVSATTQLLGARAPADEQTGALFTARQPAADLQPSAVTRGGNSTAFPFRPGASAAEPAQLVSASDPLFARRPPAQGQP